MSYEILLTDHGLEIIHLTGMTFNSLTTWCVQFDNGKEVMLYNSGNEWIQCNGDRLNIRILMAIGKCINDAIVKKNSAANESYFYDMLLGKEV